MNILVAYATAHGSTKEVAEFIGRILTTYNAKVTVADVQDIQYVDTYDAFVLGSPIHGGLWLQEMCNFTDRFHAQLSRKPSYFWITCIRALEPDGYEHALEYYIDHKTLNSFNVRDVAVFTGKLNPDAITRQEQWYLASHYDGKQRPGYINNDFRDWEVIAAWANRLAKDLQLKPVVSPLSVKAL